MTTPAVIDVKPFIGSRDFDTSRELYVALGWKLNWEDDNIAELELGDYRFYLQRYCNEERCQNTMLHITVDDDRSWCEKARQELEWERFKTTQSTCKVDGPKEEPYGALVTYVCDPSGTLLHFA